MERDLAGAIAGIPLAAVGVDQVITGARNIAYGRRDRAGVEELVYAATGSQTATVLVPAAATLSLWAIGPRLAGVGARAGASVSGSRLTLTEFKDGEGMFTAGGRLDRWFRFWKYDKPAATVWDEPAKVLGGWWTVGKVESLIVRDPRFSAAWFDAMAHKGVHMLSGKLLWPLKAYINTSHEGAILLGWVKFGEEFIAYNVGHLAVGRLHGVGPFALYEVLSTIKYRYTISAGGVSVVGGYVYFKWQR